MINEIDVKDWQMLTTPLMISELKEGDIFSVLGNKRAFEIIILLDGVAYVQTPKVLTAFSLPTFMEVFPWVKP